LPVDLPVDYTVGLAKGGVVWYNHVAAWLVFREKSQLSGRVFTSMTLGVFVSLRGLAAFHFRAGIIYHSVRICQDKKVIFPVCFCRLYVVYF
jgi:hypothetical protein